MSASVPFRSVDLSSLTYGEMIKDTSARLYVVPLAPSLSIQTTPMTLTTSLEDPSIPFVYVASDAKLTAFFRDTEAAIADACIAHKQDWFAIAKNLEDDVLRRGFKSFFDPEKGFKLKVAPDVPCFDASKKPIGREDIPAGTVVRAILELSRICFGKHEYGANWKITQLQCVPTECLIDTEDVPDDVDAIDNASDSDIDEFL
jgi:hypothetical protein